MENENKKRIAMTNNGYEVYMEIESIHMLAHKNMPEELIAEAVAKINYVPTFMMDTVDLGRIIGQDACVSVTAEDDVRWVCRPGRSIESPVVFNKQPVDTSLVTVGICTDREDGLVTVFTAFPGIKAPKEPNDPRMTDAERPEALEFWRKHALCNIQ